MEIENWPLVSVLMTSYNREKYIAEAIDSVLKSTYTNFELIIVDDCSNDSTVEIAKSYQAKDNRVKVYINEINLGDYPNRNKAASYAKGKYLKYLDSDDMIYKYSLAIMVEAMEKFPEAALGITSRNPVPYMQFPILLSPEETYKKHYFEYGFLDYGPSGTILKRDVFELNGKFSGKRHIGDVECWSKIAMKSYILELQPSLTFWRQHEGQEIKTEQQEGQVSEEFFINHYKFQFSILNDNQCPLSIEQKLYLVKKKSRIVTKEILKRFIKTRELNKCIKLYKNIGLQLKNLF